MDITTGTTEVCPNKTPHHPHLYRAELAGGFTGLTQTTTCQGEPWPDEITSDNPPSHTLGDFPDPFREKVTHPTGGTYPNPYATDGEIEGERRARWNINRMMPPSAVTNRYKANRDIEPGERVEAGDTIGYAGNTRNVGDRTVGPVGDIAGRPVYLDPDGGPIQFRNIDGAETRLGDVGAIRNPDPVDPPDVFAAMIHAAEVAEAARRKNGPPKNPDPGVPAGHSEVLGEYRWTWTGAAWHVEPAYLRDLARIEADALPPGVTRLNMAEIDDPLDPKYGGLYNGVNLVGMVRRTPGTTNEEQAWDGYKWVDVPPKFRTLPTGGNDYAHRDITWEAPGKPTTTHTFTEPGTINPQGITIGEYHPAFRKQPGHDQQVEAVRKHNKEHPHPTEPPTNDGTVSTPNISGGDLSTGLPPGVDNPDYSRSSDGEAGPVDAWDEAPTYSGGSAAPVALAGRPGSIPVPESKRRRNDLQATHEDDGEGSCTCGYAPPPFASEAQRQRSIEGHVRILAGAKRFTDGVERLLFPNGLPRPTAANAHRAVALGRCSCGYAADGTVIPVVAAQFIADHVLAANGGQTPES